MGNESTNRDVSKSTLRRLKTRAAVELKCTVTAVRDQSCSARHSHMFHVSSLLL